MNNEILKNEIIPAKFQTVLHGYKEYFNYFNSLYSINKLPRTILLNGQRGLGKSTFAFHFINYLLSSNYNIKQFEIDPNDPAYINIHNQTHPNFFLIDNNSSEDAIKIDQSRKLLTFLNKSTYQKDLKVILIDNVELLNKNSANALLKSLEEPPDNTYFFLINDSSRPILETIKSRSVQFNIYFNISKKKDIFKKIAEDYNFDFSENNLEKFLYFDTPGNLLYYLFYLQDAKINLSDNLLQCIFYFIEKCKTKKDIKILNFLSTFIEIFYNELSTQNSQNINVYFNRKYKILNLINESKKFNLDIKNLLTSINNIIKNETR
tara:strand:- start:961 stop:1923 length:963 start_codon:yes stop_codon:yes gene_type:complete